MDDMIKSLKGISGNSDIEDLRYLDFSDLSCYAVGNPDSFKKTFNNGIYYKVSMLDYNTMKIIGHESINEVVVHNICDFYNWYHVSYSLHHARIIINDKEYCTYICSSNSFRNDIKERVTTFKLFYEMNHIDEESPTNFALRYNSEYFKNMMVLDYLIANRDRHGNNIEMTYFTDTDTYELAPMFDHGCSFMSPQYNNWMGNTDRYYLADFKVNNYIGSESLVSNVTNYCSGYGKLDKIPYSKFSYGIPEELNDLISSEYKMFIARLNYFNDVLMR